MCSTLKFCFFPFKICNLEKRFLRAVNIVMHHFLNQSIWLITKNYFDALSHQLEYQKVSLIFLTYITMTFQKLCQVICQDSKILSWGLWPKNIYFLFKTTITGTDIMNKSCLVTWHSQHSERTFLKSSVFESLLGAARLKDLQSKLNMQNSSCAKQTRKIFSILKWLVQIICGTTCSITRWCMKLYFQDLPNSFRMHIKSRPLPLTSRTNVVLYYRHNYIYFWNYAFNTA